MPITGLLDTLATTKQYYPNFDILRVVYQQLPLYMSMEKDERAGGYEWKYPLIFSNGGGRSANFRDARADARAPANDAFILNALQDYGVFQIDMLTVKSLMNDRQAFISQLYNEMTAKEIALMQSVNHAMYRNGGGARGQIASIAGTVVTLVEPTDALFFPFNATIQGAATDGTSGAPLGGTATLVSVDSNAGTLTASLDWTVAIPGIAVGDFLFINGDFGAKPAGLDGYIPAVAPTDTFKGVDRAQDPIRLGGNRLDGSFMTYEEALIQGKAQVMPYGGNVDLYLMNHLDYANAIKSVQGQIRIPNENIPTTRRPDLAITPFNLPTAHGNIRIYPDAACQRGIAWGLDMRSWSCVSVGSMAQNVTSIGGNEQKIRILEDDDAIEGRIASYYDIACKAPGWNVRVTLPSS